MVLELRTCQYWYIIHIKIYIIASFVTIRQSILGKRKKRKKRWDISKDIVSKFINCLMVTQIDRQTHPFVVWLISVNWVNWGWGAKTHTPKPHTLVGKLEGLHGKAGILDPFTTWHTPLQEVCQEWGKKNPPLSHTHTHKGPIVGAWCGVWSIKF